MAGVDRRTATGRARVVVRGGAARRGDVRASSSTVRGWLPALVLGVLAMAAVVVALVDGAAGDGGQANIGSALQPADVGEIETGPDREATSQPAPEPPRAEQAPSAGSGSSDLEVHFLDVGQGDATLLVHGETSILIDTGRYQASDVVDHVTAAGIDELDLVVITHPHADHIGQFDRLADAVTITETWWSGSTTTSLTFERALAALERSDAAYEQPRAGDAARIGSLLVEVVHPPVGIDLDDVHDAGLVVRVTFGSLRVLFTGDAEAAVEARMVDQHPELLDAEVLQVGHHGSDTSTTPAFLAAVSPDVAVYSAGLDNPYGHPAADVIDRLASAGVEVYGTSTHGTVVLSSDGQQRTITTRGADRDR